MKYPMARRKKKTPFGVNLFWALVIALFIISFAVVVVLQCRPLYYLDIRLLKLDAVSGVPASAIRKDYDSLIHYLSFWNREQLTFSSFAMSEHGRIHFADCKKIFDAIQILCIVTGAGTLISFIIHKHGGNSRYLRMAGILTILIPSALGILAVWKWDVLFETFHKVLFHNDYWLFDAAQDPIILVLPDAFFFQCAIVIFAIVLLGGLICIVRAHSRKRRVAAWRSRRS